MASTQSNLTIIPITSPAALPKGVTCQGYTHPLPESLARFERKWGFKPRTVYQLTVTHAPQVVYYVPTAEEGER